jgi:DNA-binding transcriptional ArsR family regulator
MKRHPARAAKIFGNARVFDIADTLARTRRLTPTELSRKIRKPLATVSNYLRTLKRAGLIRLETDGYRNWYSLTRPREVRASLRALRSLASRSK